MALAGPAASAADATEPVGPAAAYELPVPGDVVRPFDPPAVRWGAGHRGVDLGSAVGSAVRAPAGGVVTFAGQVAGRGVVTILHDDGLRSSFEPVSTRLHTGDRVSTGDEVAMLDAAATEPGVGHCAPQACVHWGVRRGETYVDPMALVATDPIVLLPLSPTG
jgi:murein DD-endopeptidase MepM/ murein hydrolase activator NlpD